MQAGHIPPLLRELESLLLSLDGEISEQFLLTQLEHYFPSSERENLDNLLFQQHFVLYHHLFLLQQQWQNQQVASLWIGYAKVQVFPCSEVSAAQVELWSGQAEKAGYYLDWTNFSAMTEQRLAQLLDDFWRQLDSFREDPAFNSAGIRVKWALSEAFTRAEVKRRYRQLALSQHPDKGGEKSLFQQLQQEYHWLLRQCK